VPLEIERRQIFWATLERVVRSERYGHLYRQSPPPGVKVGTIEVRVTQ
jgi:hypothetical protein